MPSQLEKKSGSHKVAKKNVVKPKTPVKVNHDLPTERKYAKRVTRSKKKRVIKLKKNLTPGAVCILLSGRHRGKRVVFLKQMPRSGTCLVTGPYMLNGCPVKRVAQDLMITTSLKLDLSKLKVPEHMTDKYFSKKRPARKSSKAGKDGDIFEEPKKSYELTEQRKQDQKTIDSQVKEAISAHAESSSLICSYLAKPFELTRGMYPHRIHF